MEDTDDSAEALMGRKETPNEWEVWTTGRRDNCELIGQECGGEEYIRGGTDTPD